MVGESRAGRVRAVFDAVVDLEPDARARRLDELCGADQVLRRQVESLLAAERTTNPLLRVLDRLVGGGPAREETKRTDPTDPYGLVGTSVGPYRVDGSLGGGGMGVVYRARDLDLDRDVALKFLPPQASRDEESLERFIREARAASALDHPAICTIHGIDRTRDGAAFIVMACYDGEPLRDRIARGPIPWREAVEIALAVAGGLQRAHEAGIVHRDIKPGNIVITRRGEVKILDFGIAKMRDQDAATRTGALVGTAAYMSPEQVRGMEVDGRSDIWSLGVVLHEMITEERPFRGDHQLVVLHAILHDEPHPIPSGIDVPPALAAVLRRALVKNRDHRYATATELVSDLEAALAGVSAESRPSTPPLRRLPHPLTSFVGREDEIARIGELLQSARLVTLTGPAGTGKTRLALEVAARLADDPDLEACFVPLAPISDPDLVASEIASALDVEEGVAPSLIDRLIERLREAGLLLILDNFEHIVAAAPMVSRLLESCPRLRVLVTSRVVLRLSGEQEYRVPPLPLPDPERRDLADVLDRFPATTLFLQRAASVDPDLSIGPDDARAIAHICARLDGLPLAIELAAARTRLLSPRAILERLGRRLDLLTGGPRDRPERHRTLRQAIAWSYDLLEPAEKMLFRRLSVFSGGCTPAAAEDVARVEGPEAAPGGTEVLDALSALVDRSLLRKATGPEGDARFWMLETIREFGLERLQSEGEEDAARRRHAEHFVALAERAAPHLTGPEQASWTARLAADHDNLRAVLDWSEKAVDATLALRLGAALWRFWAIRGHLQEGRQRLERLVSLPGAAEPTRSRAAALAGLGTMIHESGDLGAARPVLEESLQIFRSLEDRGGTAMTLNHLGWVAVACSDLEGAASLNEEAAELARELGDRRGLALALDNLGWLAHMQSEFATARERHQASLELFRELGDERGYARALISRAWADRVQGRLGSAEESVREALSVLNRVGERQILGWGQFHLGCLQLDRGDVALARETLAESIETWRRSGNLAGLGWSTAGLAEALIEAGELDRAEPLLRESLKHWEYTGSPLDVASVRCTAARLNRIRGDRTEARAILTESLASLGRMGDRFRLAQAVEESARVLAAEADWSHVATLMGAAEGLRDAIGAPLSPLRRAAWKEMEERGREEIGAVAFERARASDSRLSVEEIVELATRLLAPGNGPIARRLPDQQGP